MAYAVHGRLFLLEKKQVLDNPLNKWYYNIRERLTDWRRNKDHVQRTGSKGRSRAPAFVLRLPHKCRNGQKVIKDWIINLKTHIGKAAHIYEAQFAEDNTGLTRDEQDARRIEQIGGYEETLKDIGKGNDNWAEFGERMLKLARGE